jgi:4-amino-4-deoxy-L-arabinose transferase-like glycosyltransferase
MKPYRLLTAAVFAAATLPRLAHRGMFVDGVTYASIARNLAIGRGSFWNLSYTSTIYPVFHEHPPLGFWLQSLWFRAFGDHLWVERAYTLAAAVLTALLIASCWRRMCRTSVRRENVDADRSAGRALTQPGNDRHPISHDAVAPSAAVHPLPLDALDWLPVLLWIIVPVVSWTIVGNLLETTVAVFTTSAVLTTWRAVDADETQQTWWSAVSGLCIVAAVLTKGPVGFFPLVVPVALLLFFEPVRVFRALLVQWLTVAACGLILWNVAAARISLTEYLNQQVMAALSGAREVGRPMTVVDTLLSEVLIPEALALALPLALLRLFAAPLAAELRRALALFAIGLAGTLPILVSSKQAGHYLVPAVPLFALAAANLGAPAVAGLVAWIHASRRQSAVTLLTAVLVLGTIAASLYPVGRDQVRLADIDRLAAKMPRDQTIRLCPASNGDWGLHAWFERLFLVSLDASGRQWPWFLRTTGGNGCVPDTCDRPVRPQSQLELLICRTSDDTPVR